MGAPVFRTACSSARYNSVVAFDMLNRWIRSARYKMAFSTLGEVYVLSIARESNVDVCGVAAQTNYRGIWLFGW